MGNFHNDCFPIFFCFSFLSVNFVLNNSIAQHQELCLSKNTWGGSWHIYLSQLRIPFMKHLKTNWKKKKQYWLYITIIKSKLQKYSWNSYLSNYLSTLIFCYLQICIYKPYNNKFKSDTFYLLWNLITVFTLKWNLLQGNISLEENNDQNPCSLSSMEKKPKSIFIQLFWGSLVWYLHTTPPYPNSYKFCRLKLEVAHRFL